jgi:hypothetical protein
VSPDDNYRFLVEQMDEHLKSAAEPMPAGLNKHPVPWDSDERVAYGVDELERDEDGDPFAATFVVDGLVGVIERIARDRAKAIADRDYCVRVVAYLRATAGCADHHLYSHYEALRELELPGLLDAWREAELPSVHKLAAAARKYRAEVERSLDEAVRAHQAQHHGEAA